MHLTIPELRQLEADGEKLMRIWGLAWVVVRSRIYHLMTQNKLNWNEEQAGTLAVERVFTEGNVITGLSGRKDQKFYLSKNLLVSLSPDLLAARDQWLKDRQAYMDLPRADRHSLQMEDIGKRTSQFLEQLLSYITKRVLNGEIETGSGLT